MNTDTNSTTTPNSAIGPISIISLLIVIRSTIGIDGVVYGYTNALIVQKVKIRPDTIINNNPNILDPSIFQIYFVFIILFYI